MTYNFLNTHIKPIKKYDGEIKGKKIVISTCFFFNSYYNIHYKNYTYINELISNIETFFFKV